jgi:hypothetical protein
LRDDHIDTAIGCLDGLTDRIKSPGSSSANEAALGASIVYGAPLGSIAQVL